MSSQNTSLQNMSSQNTSSVKFNYSTANLIMSIGLKIFIAMMVVLVFIIHPMPRKQLLPDGILHQRNHL